MSIEAEKHSPDNAQNLVQVQELEIVEEEEEADEETEDGEEVVQSTKPVGDRSEPLVIDIEEGRYNARDVLAMCRIYPLVLDDLERTDTSQVYEVDRQLAVIALQMTRVGMPVDLAEKERVGTSLRKVRDNAAAELNKVIATNRDKFIEMVARYQAGTVRKKDPAAGSPVWTKYKLDGKPTPKWPEGRPVKDAEGEPIVESVGPPHSNESAFLARLVLRAEKFRTTIEEGGVNLGAKVQQAALLQLAGVPLIARTEKTAMPKINKEILDVQSHHPAARHLLAFTLAGAAVRNFIDNLELDADGILHPEWIIHKITGRWGSSPNVQNWSVRAGGGLENLRRMIAARPGYKIVSADQAQLEARIIAADSQDPFLIDIFKQNKDIHGEIAGVVFEEWPKLAEIFKQHKGTACGLPPKCIKCGATGLGDKGACPGCGYDNETKCDFCKRRNKIRDIVKRLEYGGFYGGEAQTLYEAVHKDFPDFTMAGVHRFLAMFATKMPRVVAWRSETLNQALKDGEIRSPILGRRQVFPMGRVEPTVVFNWKPQSGGADLWDLGAIEFCKKWDQTGTEVRLNHNGHDSVMILTREDLVPNVSKDIHTCWEREWGGVPFLMEVKAGLRWSEGG